MGKGSNRFALLLTFMILVVSFGHTVQMYRNVGYGKYEAFTVTVFIEGIFLLSTYTLSQNRIAGRKSGWPLKLGFGYGAVHVLFSNLHHSADLSYVFDAGYAGWALGASVFVGLIVIELIVSYGVADGQDTEQTASRTNNGQSTEKQTSQSTQTDAVSEHTTTGSVRTDEKESNGQADSTPDNIHADTLQPDGSGNAVGQDVNQTHTDGDGLENDCPDDVADAPNVRRDDQAHADTNGQTDTVRKLDNNRPVDTSDELSQRRAGRQNRTDGDRTDGAGTTTLTDSDNGRTKADRTDEKKKTSRKPTVPERVVEQAYLQFVAENKKPPSFRELMRKAKCSKHMAGKVINRYKDQENAV